MLLLEEKFFTVVMIGIDFLLKVVRMKCVILLINAAMDYVVHNTFGHVFANRSWLKEMFVPRDETVTRMYSSDVTVEAHCHAKGILSLTNDITHVKT